MVYGSSRTWKYLERAIPSKDSCAIVALGSDGAFCGTLLATARQYVFSNDFSATVDYFYVLPAKRGTPVAMKMLTAFKRWAGNREVAEIRISNHFGGDSTKSARLFAKLEMTPIGGQHSMWTQRT